MTVNTNIGSSNNPQQGVPNFSVPLIDPLTQGINKPWWLFFINVWNRSGGGADNHIFLPGDVKPMMGPLINSIGQSLIPNGWLLADGSAVNRLTYSDLFNAIGTIWGSGDGIGTFNVPNLINKMLIGAGNTYTLGTSYNVGTSASTIQAAAVNWIIKT